MEEILALRAEIRMLQVLQVVIALFTGSAMGLSCLLGLTENYKKAVLAAAFFAISGVFAVGKTDFKIAQLSHYLTEQEETVKVSGYELWRSKKKKWPMGPLDVGAGTVVFFLFIASLFQTRDVLPIGRYTMTVHSLLSISLFAVAIASIVFARWLESKT